MFLFNDLLVQELIFGTPAHHFLSSCCQYFVRMLKNSVTVESLCQRSWRILLISKIAEVWCSRSSSFGWVAAPVGCSSLPFPQTNNQTDWRLPLRLNLPFCSLWVKESWFLSSFFSGGSDLHLWYHVKILFIFCVNSGYEWGHICKLNLKIVVAYYTVNISGY